MLIRDLWDTVGTDVNGYPQYKRKRFWTLRRALIELIGRPDFG